MKVTIRVETTTFETTHQGERIDAGTVKALTSKTASWDDVKAEALALTHTPIDETPDPLEGAQYSDADAALMAMEPANILAAE